MEFKKKVIFNDPNSEPPKNGIGQKDKELLEFNYNTKQWVQSKLTINLIDELKKVIVYSDKAPAKNQLWGKGDKIYQYNQSSNSGIENINNQKIDYTETPFTIEALGSGNLYWNLAGNQLEYSKNGGPWTASDYVNVQLVEGDEVAFKGVNTEYNFQLSIECTASFNAKGNIMSLFYGDDFKTASTLTIDYQFSGFFYGCETIVSAGDLQLPATTLTSNCYEGMFYDCTGLTQAPALPATTLVDACYYDMFNGCANLNYIKAMFTTTPASTFTGNWVNHVAANGTFVKNSAASWDVVGVNGVPAGWTVETAEE